MNPTEAQELIGRAVQLRTEDVKRATHSLTERQAAGLARLLRDRPTHPEVTYETNSTRSQAALSSQSWLAEAQRHAAAANAAPEPGPLVRQRHSWIAFVEARWARLQAEQVLDQKQPFWEAPHQDPLAVFFADVAKSFTRTQTRQATPLAASVKAEAAKVELTAWTAVQTDLAAMPPKPGPGEEHYDLDLAVVVSVPPSAWWPEVKWATDAIIKDAWRSGRPFLVERWGDYLRAVAFGRSLEAKLANPEGGQRACYKCGVHLKVDERRAGAVRVDFDRYNDAVPPAPFCARGQPHEPYTGQARFLHDFPEKLRRIREYHSTGLGLNRA